MSGHLAVVVALVLAVAVSTQSATTEVVGDVYGAEAIRYHKWPGGWLTCNIQYHVLGADASVVISRCDKAHRPDPGVFVCASAYRCQPSPLSRNRFACQAHPLSFANCVQDADDIPILDLQTLEVDSDLGVAVLGGPDRGPFTLLRKPGEMSALATVVASDVPAAINANPSMLHILTEFELNDRLGPVAAAALHALRLSAQTVFAEIMHRLKQAKKNEL